ncbi:hypothetical protein RclHR1_16120004 [Rhizophagus clarus]|uniref:Uncharacterized protein n=1 Tax=Rhizophagus clarus TaxID=94130 RepID=A0A2Z6QH15_9GLOM|nr:hypothetical protein RclHR1_16120004 [Rhizophagus clarus]
MKLDSRNYCWTNITNWTLELRVLDEYYELDLGIEVSFWTNNTNWALEFRVSDEYYEPDFRIEVSGGGEVNFVISRNGFNASSFPFTNNTNWTLELRFLDKYYELDFGIEASCWQDESEPTLSESGLGILGISYGLALKQS